MIIACEIYNNIQHIDEVWIVPCGDGRKDKNLRCSAYHRIKMLECIKNDLVYQDLPVYIDITEYKNGTFMPTYDLLCKLQNEYPSYKFSFCFGSDIAKGLPFWEDGNTIIKNFELIIIKRPGFLLDEVSYIEKCKIMETNFDNSSTQIRNRIDDVLSKKHKIHLGISGLTSRSVLKYIYDNNLYKVETYCEDLGNQDKENNQKDDYFETKK